MLRFRMRVRTLLCIVIASGIVVRILQVERERARCAFWVGVYPSFLGRNHFKSDEAYSEARTRFDRMSEFTKGGIVHRIYLYIGIR